MCAGGMHTCTSPLFLQPNCQFPRPELFVCQTTTKRSLRNLFCRVELAQQKHNISHVSELLQLYLLKNYSALILIFLFLIYVPFQMSLINAFSSDSGDRIPWDQENCWNTKHDHGYLLLIVDFVGKQMFENCRHEPETYINADGNRHEGNHTRT